ncbi:putative sugar kinase [Salmonella enterica subsp. enterica]|nr:putative sugar kinase [Salmonella enterica subsp. enterica]
MWGDDDTGNSLLAELESLGVNTRYTPPLHARPCRRSQRLWWMPKESGLSLIIPARIYCLDADWLNDIDFSPGGMWCWRMCAGMDGAKQAFTLARQAGVMTVLDGDITPQDISELVALSDHAAFSEPGLARLTGMSEAIDALKKAQMLTNGHVYVTRGSEGCNWLEKAAVRHQPGFTVEVVDTTGAGDVFHGALAFGLASGYAIEEAVRFASGVAALKCTRPGGRAGIPDCEQTRSFLSLFV